MEEGERDAGDIERALGVPDGERIVELLCGGEGGQIPGVSAVVAVLGVAASSDGGVGSDAAVDGVDRAEGVDVDLVVGERAVRARLERERVASGSGVEGVNGREDAVGVLARASTTGVRGRESATRVPVRLRR